VAVVRDPGTTPGDGLGRKSGSGCVACMPSGLWVCPRAGCSLQARLKPWALGT
jgi:hypothetical protein